MIEDLAVVSSVVGLLSAMTIAIKINISSKQSKLENDKSMDFFEEGLSHLYKREYEDALRFFNLAIRTNDKIQTYHIMREKAVLGLNRQQAEEMEEERATRVKQEEWKKTREQKLREIKSELIAFNKAS